MWDLYFVCCGSCILPPHWMLVEMRNVLFKLPTINCHRSISNCRGIAWSSHFFSNRIFACMLLAFLKPDCLSSLRCLLLFEFIFIAENEFGFLVVIWRLHHSGIFNQVVQVLSIHGLIAYLLIWWQIVFVKVARKVLNTLLKMLRRQLELLQGLADNEMW